MVDRPIHDACNAAVDAVLSGSVQAILDNVEPPPKKPWEVYPIMAMPIVGGDVALAAEAIDHRSRAVKISNGVTEVWLPRSHIRRIIGTHQVVVSDWIAKRKSQFFKMMANQSPQYLEWIEKRRQDSLIATDFTNRTGGFQYKFDGKV